MVYAFQVTPVGGATIPQNINFSFGNYPYGSTVTFAPASLPAASSTTTVTLTIVTASYPSSGADTSSNQQTLAVRLACIGFGALLLPFSRRFRRRPLRLLATGLLLSPALAPSHPSRGCGTGWNHEDFPMDIYAASGNYPTASTST